MAVKRVIRQKSIIIGREEVRRTLTEQFYDEKMRRKVGEEKRLPDEVFPMKEVTAEELIKLSTSGPGLAYKCGGKYYYASVIPQKGYPHVMFYSASGRGKYEHQCASSSKICKRMSPVPFERGGCKKVSDRKNHIWKFDFIREAYESFNMPQEVFIVVKCKFHVWS